MAKYRKKPVVIEATQWKGWYIAPNTSGPLIAGLEAITPDHDSWDNLMKMHEDGADYSPEELAWIDTLEGGAYCNAWRLDYYGCPRREISVQTGHL
jgi:hypothetical protein